MSKRSRWPLLLAVAALAGCVLEKSRAEIEAEDKAAGRKFSAAPAAARSAPRDTSLLSAPGPLSRLVALDDSARKLPADPRAPGWLYAAGVEGAQHSFFDPTTAADSAHLAAMPESYYLNEIAGSQTYTGWHLTELVKRFPSDTLADDAAFLVAQNHDFVRGECEGFFFCYLAAGVDSYARFLRAHPASPLVAAAVTAADSAMRDLFDKVEARTVEFVAVDTTITDVAQQGHHVVSVERSLREFEEAARGLPATERDRALAMLEPIKARWIAVRDRP